MFTLDLPTLLQSLRPGEKWCVRGDQKDYANLEWLDQTAAPTEQEMLDAELAAAKSARITKAKSEAASRILGLAPAWKQDNCALGGYDGLYDAVKSITNVTAALPSVVTCSAHGYKTGDKVVTADIGGITGATLTDNLITVVDANSFSLDGATGVGVYTSGGTVKRQMALGMKNEIKAARADSDTAEAAINALTVVADVVNFTW